jgi:hypothetical protein
MYIILKNWSKRNIEKKGSAFLKEDEAFPETVA